MKKGFAKLYLFIGSSLLSALAALRLVLELVGYATIADDAKEATGIVKWLFDVALALPWWAVWWPLFLSYIWAGLISFDFSFDLFKRERREMPMSKAQRLEAICHNFSNSTNYIISENHSFDDADAFKIASLKDILKRDLDDYGISYPDTSGENLGVTVMVLKATVSAIKPYLDRGDFDGAVEASSKMAKLLS